MFPLERQALATIRGHHLLDKPDTVLVSVSGGPDSVALLHFLWEWKTTLSLSLSVVHFNHELRGEESEADAEFVKDLCGKLSVPCLVKRLTIQQGRSDRKPASIQAMARHLRYATLTLLAEQGGFKKVALGHTMNDQAETVLMNMVRGAGLDGLSGMPVFHPPSFIRPFLQVSRAEIEDYLRAKNVFYRMDSSNQNRKYRRNHFRLEVMPRLREINPQIDKVISRQVQILHDESEYLQQLAKQVLNSVTLDDNEEEGKRTLDFKKLASYPQAIQRRVVRLCIQHLGTSSYPPSSVKVEDVIRHINQKWSSNFGIQLGDVHVSRQYQELCFSKSQIKQNGLPSELFRQKLELPLPGSVVWPLTGQTLEACWVQDVPPSWQHDSSCVYLDAERVSWHFVVRQWREGDRFCPFGMDGKRKKVQDFFSDLKIKPAKRFKIPIVESPEGIVWIGGLRSDHRFRITKKTKKFLGLQLSPSMSQFLKNREGTCTDNKSNP